MPSKRLLQQAAAGLMPHGRNAVPTWSGLLPILLCLYLEPATPDIRRQTRMHLEQMCKLADAAMRAAAEREHMVASVLRGAGMYGLLCEIVGKEVLAKRDDKDLLVRVSLAIAEHEAALRDAMETARG